MVSFARARTRSLLSRLLPTNTQLIKNKKDILDNSQQDLIRRQKEQDNYFLEAIKNGGMWFS